MQDFYETIVNWDNKFGNQYNSRFVQAMNACTNYKKTGFARSDSQELLLANGLSAEASDEILDKVYGTSKKALAARKFSPYIVPSSYADIANLVEFRLAKSGPAKTVSYLTESPMPIIEANAKHRRSLLRLAEVCIEDPSNIEHFHAEIEPYMEEVMLNSVLLAEQQDGNVRRLAENTYLVNFMGREATVDLEKATSTSERFKKGHFDKFGLADEFIVKAHDTASPYARLTKSLNR